MANEKSVIVKSVSLERTAEFEEFVACQKNFSRSIRVLIQQAIFQRGGKIVDIWEEYEKDVQNIVFRNEMNSAPYEEEKSDQRGGSLEETAILDESRHEDPSTSRSLVGSDEKTDNDNGIPEGYQ